MFYILMIPIFFFLLWIKMSKKKNFYISEKGSFPHDPKFWDIFFPRHFCLSTFLYFDIIHTTFMSTTLILRHFDETNIILFQAVRIIPNTLYSLYIVHTYTFSIFLQLHRRSVPIKCEVNATWLADICFVDET